MLQVIKALNKCNFPEIVKDVDVDYLGADGRRRKYSYASLPNILNVVTPELKKNGLLISQLTAGNGVTTYLFHESGEYIFEKSSPEIPYSNIQEWGASITYQRRYAIVSMLGLIADEDNDGKVKLYLLPTEVKPKLDENLIGGKPIIDEYTFNRFVEAIKDGNYKGVESAIKKYSPTFIQMDELNKLINSKKAEALKKSTK